MCLIFGGFMRYIVLIVTTFVIPSTTVSTRTHSPVSAIHNEERQLLAEIDIPNEGILLGTVDLPRQANADGMPLNPGRYELLLTKPSTTPQTSDASNALGRWVEFRQEDGVKGREMVTIVSEAEITAVAKSAPPTVGSTRIEILKDNEYLRIWLNNAGIHYLIHLAIG